MPTQKSYSSSETLKAFDHEQRLHYGGCVTDLVHHEADEYSRQGRFLKKSASDLFFIAVLALNHMRAGPEKEKQTANFRITYLA